MLAQIPAVASKTIRVPQLMPFYGSGDYTAEKRRTEGRYSGEREITVTLRANKGGGGVEECLGGEGREGVGSGGVRC